MGEKIIHFISFLLFLVNDLGIGQNDSMHAENDSKQKSSKAALILNLRVCCGIH